MALPVSLSDHKRRPRRFNPEFNATFRNPGRVARLARLKRARLKRRLGELPAGVYPMTEGISRLEAWGESRKRTPRTLEEELHRLGKPAPGPSPDVWDKAVEDYEADWGKGSLGGRKRLRRRNPG